MDSAEDLPPWHRDNCPWMSREEVDKPPVGSKTRGCKFNSGHTRFYLDPHPSCDACRLGPSAAASATKCNWKDITCSLCVGVAPWARIKNAQKSAYLASKRTGYEATKQRQAVAKSAAAGGHSSRSLDRAPPANPRSRPRGTSEGPGSARAAHKGSPRSQSQSSGSFAGEPEFGEKSGLSYEAILELNDRHSLGATAFTERRMIPHTEDEVQDSWECNTQHSLHVVIETDPTGLTRSELQSHIVSKSAEIQEKDLMIQKLTDNLREQQALAQVVSDPPGAQGQDGGEDRQAATEEFHEGSEVTSAEHNVLNLSDDETDFEDDEVSAATRRQSKQQDPGSVGAAHAESDMDVEETRSVSQGRRTPPPTVRVQTPVVRPTGAQASGGLRFSEPLPATEVELFDVAKATISRTLQSLGIKCELQREVKDPEKHVPVEYTIIPIRRAKPPVEFKPSTLGPSPSTIRAFHLCNDFLRGGEAPNFTEPYVPAKHLELQAVPVKSRLGKGKSIPFHPTGMRGGEHPFVYHGTNQSWGAHHSGAVQSIGQDCQNAAGGVSFLEWAFAALTGAIDRERQSETPDWGAVCSVVDDVSLTVDLAVKATQIQLARGFANANLVTRGTVKGDSKAVSDLLWHVPCEVTDMGPWRAEAVALTAEQDGHEVATGINRNALHYADAVRKGKVAPPDNRQSVLHPSRLGQVAQPGFSGGGNNPQPKKQNPGNQSYKKGPGAKNSGKPAAQGRPNPGPGPQRSTQDKANNSGRNQKRAKKRRDAKAAAGSSGPPAKVSKPNV